MPGTGTAWRSGHLLVGCLLAAGCGSGGGKAKLDAGSESRLATIVDVLTTADAELLRERPRLVAGKYDLMATDAFAFFRGSLALFLHDWQDPARGLASTRFAAGDAQPFGLGDAHPENFGTLRNRDGAFRLEPNDFDTADRLPYLWDVRRFAVGMCVAARVANPSDPVARLNGWSSSRAVARAAAASYAETMRALAAGGAVPVIEDGAGSAVLDDLFRRSRDAWENQTDLQALTRTRDFPRLARGGLDPAEPEDVARTLTPRARLAIAATLASYRASLVAPPPVAELIPLDAVQQFGQGVGSFPRVRALALVRGPSTAKKDDLVLELKELAARDSLPLPVAGTFATSADRLLAALASGWTARDADPLWGVGSWVEFPVQIRNVSAGHRTVRVSRLDGALGTPEAVTGLGVVLARLIARMHAAPLPGGGSLARQIAEDLATDPEGFADEQADIALAGCDRVSADWQLFLEARARLGPTLGVTGEPGGTPDGERGVLYDPTADPRSAPRDPVTGAVAINEIAATDVVDFVELANASPSTQMVSDLRVTDSDEDGGPRLATATRLAGAAALDPGDRLVVVGGYASVMPGPQRDCSGGISPCFHASWGISASEGETIYVLSATDVIVDQVTYPGKDVPAGQSWSRWPDLAGPFTPAPPTPVLPNTAP